MKTNTNNETWSPFSEPLSLGLSLAPWGRLCAPNDPESTGSTGSSECQRRAGIQDNGSVINGDTALAPSHARRHALVFHSCFCVFHGFFKELDFKELEIHRYSLLDIRQWISMEIHQ